MGASRSELTSSGSGSGGPDHPPAVTNTAEAEYRSAHNVCTPDERPTRPGVVTVTCGPYAASGVVLGEPATSYQKSLSGLPPGEEPSCSQQPMSLSDSSSAGDRDLLEPLLDNFDVRLTPTAILIISDRFWTRESISRVDRHSVMPGRFPAISRHANKTGESSAILSTYTSAVSVRPVIQPGVALSVGECLHVRVCVNHMRTVAISAQVIKHVSKDQCYCVDTRKAEAKGRWQIDQTW